jgi:hypothetical protein
MRKLLCVLVLSCACGSSSQQAPGPATPSGSVVGGFTPPVEGTPAFASHADCERLVDHIDEVRFLSSPPAPAGVKTDVFRAQNQDPNWHRARVEECTITVDSHDYVCLMRARDTETAWHCNAKFFASTMASYSR